MRKKRISTLALVLALVVGINALRPSRADAISTWGIVGIAVGAYAVLVVVATSLIYNPATEEGSDAMQEADRRNHAVNIGKNCRPTADGNVALVCW